MSKTIWNPLAQMLEHEAFSAYHMVTERNYDMPRFHTHNHFEFFLFMEGNARIVLEDRVYTPEPYTLFVYPPGIMHRSSAQGEIGRYERAYVYTTPDFIKDISTPEFPMAQIINSAIEKQIFSITLHPEIGADLVKQMDEIISHAQFTAPAEQMLNKCRMTMLLISICQCIDTTLDDRSSTRAPIHHIISYINEHLAEPLTLDDLSAHFYISKYYLLHTFKACTNMSVRQYIISKRIIHAQVLLQAGATPSEAARASGFNDYSGFYRAFIKQTGLTPQNFKQKWMKDPV